MNIFNRIKNRLPFLSYFSLGRSVFNDSSFKETLLLNQKEVAKSPSRTTIINFLLKQFDGETKYLEIGVRNPEDNFNYIESDVKYSVDPGIEFEDHTVDFLMTSDSFFDQLNKGLILSKQIRFDIIFIDGLHEAHQVDRDIKNALNYISDNGFIVLHDCNPLTEWHARADYGFHLSPAAQAWNGTVWKAFVKWRQKKSIYSCCIDTDWGVGILSKERMIGLSLKKSLEFYDYNDFAKDRKDFLGLISFNEFKERLNNSNHNLDHDLIV